MNQDNLDKIQSIANQWYEFWRKLINRKLKTEPADIVTSALINALAMIFVELVNKFDVGYHDKLFQDFMGTIKAKYDQTRPEPKSRIITLN